MADPAAMAKRMPASNTAWERQAAWYDARHGDTGDLHHRKVIIPALLRWLPLLPEQLVLDCCCGQGVVGRTLAAQGLQVLGVDAAPSLIEAASKRAGPSERYLVGDAHRLTSLLEPASVAHAVLVLALQDLDPMDDVLTGIATALQPGGRLVAVLTHPCFRIPQTSDWHWQGDQRCSRRIDGYLNPQQIAIATHPGQRSAHRTSHHHRPISAYITAFAAAGLPLIGSEELCTPRRGSSGKRSAAEDRAAREFPMFWLVVGQKAQARSSS
jgi:ubiquinone/menaquinone biosynthesis C-methylase UbiE